MRNKLFVSTATATGMVLSLAVTPASSTLEIPPEVDPGTPTYTGGDELYTRGRALYMYTHDEESTRTGS